MDPLAEKYYSISPYAYVANNPLRYIDPTGMLTDNGKNIDASVFQKSSKTKLFENAVMDGDLSLSGISNILTNLVSIYDMPDLYNDQISISGLTIGGTALNYNVMKGTLQLSPSNYENMAATLTTYSAKNGVAIIYLLNNVRKLANGKISAKIPWDNNYNTIRAMLYVHEYFGRYTNKLDGEALIKSDINKIKELNLKVGTNYYQQKLRDAGLR